MHRATLSRGARAGFAAAVLLVAAGTLPAQDPPSEEAIDFFKRNCASCHTIGGGRLTGPDLKNVHERRERDWLVRFVSDPKSVIDSGDPYARKLVEEARGALMPNLQGMNKTLAGKLIDLIKAESALEKSRFAGIVISDRPLTAADVERGARLFTGREAFQGGAPACNSCHSVREHPGFGGGILGPDLTNAYSRLEGRKAIAAWLSSPPSVVMQPVFAGHDLDGEEILGVVAFLKDQAERGDAPAEGRPSLDFVLTGLGGAAVLLVAMDLAWRRRYRAVRRPLVARIGS